MQNHAITCYSVQSRDRIFVKGYRFLSFGISIRENIGKNISKILSNKYNQKHFDDAKQSATDVFKVAPKLLQKINSRNRWSKRWFDW